MNYEEINYGTIAQHNKYTVSLENISLDETQPQQQTADFIVDASADAILRSMKLISDYYREIYLVSIKDHSNQCDKIFSFKNKSTGTRCDVIMPAGLYNEYTQLADRMHRTESIWCTYTESSQAIAVSLCASVMPAEFLNT